MNNLIKRITLLSILIFVSIFLVSCKNNRKDYLFNEMKSYEFSRTSSKDSIYHSDIVVLNESYNYILTDSLENTYYYRDFGSKTYEYKENNRGITSKEVTLDFSYINEAITNIKYSDLDKISDYEYDSRSLKSYS